MTTRIQPITEKQLQHAIVEAAQMLGFRVYHTFLSIRSDPGFPDLVLLNPRQGRRLLFVEVKGENGRLSDAQRAWLADLHAVGIEAYSWWPAQWRSGEIERVLKGEETTWTRQV